MRMGKGDNKEKSFFKAIIEIIQEDHFHILWIVIMFIVAILSVWASFFMKGAKTCLEELKNSSDLYIISLGFLATSSFDLASSIYLEKKKGVVPHFVKVKLGLTILGFTVCMLVPFIAIGYYRDRLVLKIIVSLGMIFMAYICYLTQFLPFPKYSNLDDTTIYDDTKKEETILKEKATNTSSLKMNGEDIKI